MAIAVPGRNVCVSVARLAAADSVGKNSGPCCPQAVKATIKVAIKAAANVAIVKPANTAMTPEGKIARIKLRV